MHIIAATTLLGAGSGFAALPVLLIALACPLMMVLMMRGMVGMARGRDDRREADHDRTTAQVPDHVPDSWTDDQR